MGGALGSWVDGSAPLDGRTAPNVAIESRPVGRSLGKSAAAPGSGVRGPVRSAALHGPADPGRIGPLGDCVDGRTIPPPPRVPPRQGDQRRASWHQRCGTAGQCGLPTRAGPVRRTAPGGPTARYAPRASSAASRAATRALFSSSARFARTLSPPVSARMRSSRNGVTDAPADAAQRGVLQRGGERLLVAARAASRPRPASGWRPARRCPCRAPSACAPPRPAPRPCRSRGPRGRPLSRR